MSIGEFANCKPTKAGMVIQGFGVWKIWEATGRDAKVMDCTVMESI